VLIADSDKHHSDHPSQGCDATRGLQPWEPVRPATVLLRNHGCRSDFPRAFVKGL